MQPDACGTALSEQESAYQHTASPGTWQGWSDVGGLSTWTDTCVKWERQVLYEKWGRIFVKVHILEVNSPPAKVQSLQHFPQPVQACVPSHVHTCLCMTAESRGHPWVAAGSSSRSCYGVHDGWGGMRFPEIFIYRFVPSPTYITTYINLTHKNIYFKKVWSLRN